MFRGASSSSCNSWVHHTCNSCHGGSRVSGSPLIYDCRDIAVVRTARTTKNLGKQFWGCANFKVCFPVFRFGCFFHFQSFTFIFMCDPQIHNFKERGQIPNPTPNPPFQINNPKPNPNLMRY